MIGGLWPYITAFYAWVLSMHWWEFWLYMMIPAVGLGLIWWWFDERIDLSEDGGDAEPTILIGLVLIAVWPVSIIGFAIYLVCSRLSGARLRRFERIKAAKEQAAKPIEKVAEELNELLKAEERTTAMLTGEASKSPRRGRKHVSP